MSSSGQHNSAKRRLNGIKRTLAVIVIFLIIALYYIKYKGMIPRVIIVYPNWKGTQSQNTTEVLSHADGSTPQSPEQDLMACGVEVQSDPVIKVEGHKTYVIGSYIENRLGVKQILTVAIVYRSETVEFYCLLCCDGKNVSVAASYSIHSDHFGFEYGTADITCQVPVTCTAPDYVAITSRSHESDDTLHNIQSFQPVRNQHSTTDFPYEFTVCISAMYDYVNVLGLVQAMEMYKILGVQKVVIYKTSCHPDIQKILDYYVEQGFVEIIPWTVTSYINVSRGWQKSVSPGELHYFGQIPALNDCLYRYMYQSRYIALQDLDEFILPLKENSWTELIPKLEETYTQYAGFEFENNIVVFPSDVVPKYTPDLWKRVRGENILQHINRLPIDPYQFNNFKVIVNPRLVFTTSVHGLLDSRGGTVRVKSEIARMYHVRNVSEELSRNPIRDTHLQDYADQLIPAVSEVLQKVLNIH